MPPPALRLTKAEFPLRIPFRLHQSEQHFTRSVIVELAAESVTGYGEGRGQIEETYDTLTAVRLDEADLADLSPVLAQIENPAARCGLEMAWLDWRGKREGRPVWTLLGLGGPATFETCMTVGLDGVEQMVEAAQELVRQGWPILKLKGGTGDDGALVRLMRERLGPQVRLRVDANTAWSPAEAERFAHETAECGLEMIEQPLAVGEWDALRKLRERAAAPIFLDEDIRTIEDVRRAAETQAADGVNVKLSRCGGLIACTEMLREARRLGLGTMLGCYVETSLGITAGTHLGELLDFADLDGNQFLAEDPFVGAKAEAGRIATPPGPGLGVARRDAAGSSEDASVPCST
jgi:L-alanine-DL-glutamate epimerase-like enolase superfamily enzyme